MGNQGRNERCRRRKKGKRVKSEASQVGMRYVRSKVELVPVHESRKGSRRERLRNSGPFGLRCFPLLACLEVIAQVVNVNTR